MNILAAPMFGSKHLIGLLFVVILVVVLLLVRKRKKIPTKDILLYLSIAFIVLEIIKIGTMWIRDGGFPMNHIPLHLCSLPLYLFPILYFAKEDSMLERIVKPAAYAAVLAAAIAALLIPTNIIGSNEAWIPFEGNFYPLISFIYHGLMIFSSIFMLRSKYYVPTFSDIPKAWLTTGCLMVVAMIVNVTMDKDFMLLNTGNGSPLVFIRDHGQFLYTFSMIVLGLFVIALIIVITIGVQRLTSKEDK